MIISYSNNFVFIKTRKTAGTSAEKLMLDMGLVNPNEGDVMTGSNDGLPWLNLKPKEISGHISYEHVLQRWPDVSNFFAFTIERDPWDKTVSNYWFHLKRLSFNGSFQKFIHNPNNIPTDWNKYTINGQIRCSILRYENLSVMLKETLNRFNPFNTFNFDSIRMKSGLREDRHYKDMYKTQRDIDIVSEAFHKEIFALGYTYV